ncbi:uncharacterized protein K441DRAFT_702035 [Cenococcum geophilum 1.58]|uniref:uncharacterized protein n=1 Tax=Cenococcum geophilum 1.58 TaxID=794803 RepID=UPI00358E2977|nr:hypothetical protein K441DRAFT_702035 [Cenococcum geophilum 1.58]
MASSMTSSLSHHRPAVLFVAGAATAFTAYIIYSSLQTPSSPDLRRSNAVRRPRRNAATNREPLARVEPTEFLSGDDPMNLLRRIQQDPPDLGITYHFGEQIRLHAVNVISVQELRDIALRSEGGANLEFANLEAAIHHVYDTLLVRFLEAEFPTRPPLLSEREALLTWFDGRGPSRDAMRRVFERHSRTFPPQIGGAQDTDGRESVAGTEVSWHTADHSAEEDPTPGDGQTLRRTLYHIAEDRARQEGVIHRGVSCNGCDAKPIRGIRWRCANCADFDLCSDCEATNSHTKTHIFYKIRVPAPYLGLPKQPPVYPGRPHLMSPSINTPLKKRLVAETKIEGEEVEALWDQFTCLADTQWREDPNNIGWAIDRRSFNQAFIPRYSTFTSAPNLIYDRIFSYYDSNRDGLIGFEEFVKGLDGMHSRDGKTKLRIVFNGYDIDDDGFIARKDVLRIFRAYYAIEKESTRNYIADSTDELSVAGALDVIQSGQPLGSAFTQSGIPPGARHRRLEEKTSDRFNDPRSRGNGAVMDDTEDVADREEILGNVGGEYRDIDVDVTTGDPLPRPQLAQGLAVEERWRRRQFYVDEEEGMKEPEGYHEEEEMSDDGKHDEAAGENPPTPDRQDGPNGSHRPRGSRSSSRVRFQDDVEMETRSNASTSSRPIGERWGGYEIPEPEKDLGKEILYQITQQAFNELLNPLFRDKEDLAMEAFATKAERRKRRADEKDINMAIASIGAYTYSGRMVERFTVAMEAYKDYLEELRKRKLTPTLARQEIDILITTAEQSVVESCQPLLDTFQPSMEDLWDAKLVRAQFAHEMEIVILNLLSGVGWLSPETPGPKDAAMQDDVAGEVPEPSNHASHSSDLELNLSSEAHVADEHDLSDSFSSIAPLPASPASPRSTNEETAYRDPTMPQFGPSSTADIAGHTSPEPPTVNSTAPLSPSPTFDSLLPPPSELPPSQRTTPTELPLPWMPRYSAERPLTPPVRVELRAAAARAREGPLWLVWLGLLDAVQRQMEERKGAGLLGFEEFERIVGREGGSGKLRFLEAWMDWVSF